jgi:prepilin-type N-terminal cleavage/methylation domain-containing protein
VKSGGFTLVELLVAMALGGLLVTGALGAFATAQQRYRENEVRARLQEHANHAFTVLEPELQMAGYGGLTPLAALPWPTTLPSALLDCGPPPRSAAGAPAAVHIASGSSWPLPACVPQGGGAVDTADVLTVTRAAARAALPTPGRVQLLSSRLDVQPGALLPDGRLPPGVRLEPGRVELHDLLQLTFYVARRADGTTGDAPALRVKELTEIAGRAARRDTEVVDGVEDLRVEEGWTADDAANATLHFTRPGLRPAARTLRALRVVLRLRAGRHDANGSPARLVAERTFLLRNPPSAGST